MYQGTLYSTLSSRYVPISRTAECVLLIYNAFSYQAMMSWGRKRLAKAEARVSMETKRLDLAISTTEGAWQHHHARMYVCVYLKSSCSSRQRRLTFISSNTIHTMAAIHTMHTTPTIHTMPTMPTIQQHCIRYNPAWGADCCGLLSRAREADFRRQEEGLGGLRKETLAGAHMYSVVYTYVCIYKETLAGARSQKYSV